MKTLSFFILCIVSFLNALSQSIISGQLGANANTKVVLEYWQDYTFHMDTLTLDKNSQFSKAYSLNHPRYFRVSIPSSSFSTAFLLVMPEENLAITIIGKEVKVAGTAGEYNSFLIALNDSIRAHFPLKQPADHNAVIKYALGKSDQFFSSFVHKQAQNIKNLNDAAIVTNKKPYPFLVKYNNDLTKMVVLKNFLKNKIISTEADNESLVKYFDRINFNEAMINYDVSTLSNLNNMIRILRFHAEKDSALNGVDPYIIERNLIKEIFRDTPLATALIGYNLQYRIKEYNSFQMKLAGVDSYVQEYGTLKYSESNLNTLRKLYAENISTIGQLDEGANAPPFNLTDSNGKRVSLQDFKNKVVYLDFWASWCGPCLKETPYLKALKNKFKNKDVEIISISIDTHKDKWLKKIKEYELDGIQLIDSIGSENSKIAKDYKIYGVPHFVLIDKKGKIYSASAFRPSELKVEEEIKLLLERE